LLRKQRKTLGGYFILPHPVVIIILWLESEFFGCSAEKKVKKHEAQNTKPS